MSEKQPSYMEVMNVIEVPGKEGRSVTFTSLLGNDLIFLTIYVNGMQQSHIFISPTELIKGLKKVQGPT